MECVTRTGRAGSAKPKNNSSKDKRREYKEKTESGFEKLVLRGIFPILGRTYPLKTKGIIMKNILSVLCLIAVCVLQADDITTANGKTYHEYTVVSWSAEGLAIVHRSGATVIPLEQWPKDQRDRIADYIKKIEKRRKAIAGRPDLKTKSGKILKKYKIIRFTGNGALISYWGGTLLVKTDDLPDDIQEKHQQEIEKAKPKRGMVIETVAAQQKFPEDLSLNNQPAKRSRKPMEDSGDGIDFQVSTPGGRKTHINTGGKQQKQTKSKNKNQKQK